MTDRNLRVESPPIVRILNNKKIRKPQIKKIRFWGYIENN